MAESGILTKIRNIEALRFLFVLLVIACHINQGITSAFPDISIYQKFINNTSLSWLVVDFFFIISGFFLFIKTDFSINFIDFAKHKLKRLMPTILVVLLITAIVSWFTQLPWHNCDNLFIVLNLQNVGLTFGNGNIPPSWYISSLFWAMCFYFYLYKSVNKNIFNLITACLTFFCYSFFVHVPKSWNVINYYYVINIGIVRAIAGIGAGYFISLLYKNEFNIINSTFSSLKSKIIISSIELYAFIKIFYYLGFHCPSYDNFLYFVILFILLFITFLINKGIISKLFDNNLSVFIGKYTYSIFLIHYLIKDLWKQYICNNHTHFVYMHPIMNLVMLYIITILMGIFLYHFVEKPFAKYLK